MIWQNLLNTFRHPETVLIDAKYKCRRDVANERILMSVCWARTHGIKRKPQQTNECLNLVLRNETMISRSFWLLLSSRLNRTAPNPRCELNWTENIHKQAYVGDIICRHCGLQSTTTSINLKSQFQTIQILSFWLAFRTMHTHPRDASSQ